MPSKNAKLLKSRSLIEPGLGLTSVQHSLDSLRTLIGGHNGLARLLDLTKLEEHRALRGHDKPIWSIAFSPDGRTAVTGGEDATLRYWDVSSRKELDRFTADGIFSSVQFSADGNQIFATNWDGKARVWRHSNGKLGDPLEFTFAASTLDLALLPEKKAFVVGNTLGQILVCDAETGVIQKIFEEHSGWVHSVEVFNAGKQILSASHDSTLRLWNVETGKTDRVYFGHSGIVNEVRVLSDGKRFMSCGADGTVRLWDVSSRRLLAMGRGSGELRGLSIAPDEKSCLTAGLDGSLWEWELPQSNEPASDQTDEITPIMLPRYAFQADFNDKHRLSVRPTDVFIKFDPLTREILYGIDWGPADGLDFIVRNGLSDDALEQHESDAVKQGFKQKRLKTATINGVNHHIGLSTKRVPVHSTLVVKAVAIEI